MADVAWSEKRKALIPGKYENGMFVPFNGDEPIPAHEVVASKPPTKIKALNEAGELEEMSPSEASNTSSVRISQWMRTKGVWWIAGITVALWTLSMIGARQSTVDISPVTDTVVAANERKNPIEASPQYNAAIRCWALADIIDTLIKHDVTQKTSFKMFARTVPLWREQAVDIGAGLGLSKIRVYNDLENDQLVLLAPIQQKSNDEAVTYIPMMVSKAGECVK